MKGKKNMLALQLLAWLRSTLRRSDRGQTTAEYALVVLGATGVAMLLLGWATQSGAIGSLFDAVMDSVVGRVK